MKEEVERIKKLVGIDHNRWEQPCTCDKCKNMCKVPCIGTPKDIEAIIDAGYADRLKETMWMVGYLAVKEKPIAMIQPTEKDGWCAFRQPGGLCELHDLGLKPTEGVKHEIDLRFHEFVEKTGKEPEYVECQIVRKKKGDEQRKTIKLSLDINDDDNDDVFCYCNGIESFKQLTEYGVGEFIVTFCWSFF